VVSPGGPAEPRCCPAAKKELHTIKRGDRELRVGVISVPSFYQDFQARMKGDPDYRSTTRDVQRLIGELKAEGIDSLVMDLRDNGGGHLSEATGLVGLFVERGPVVQLRETIGRIEVLDDPEPGIAWEGPLVVLVNRASASASEIFAGAIQDYQRGLVVEPDVRLYGRDERLVRVVAGGLLDGHRIVAQPRVENRGERGGHLLAKGLKGQLPLIGGGS